MISIIRDEEGKEVGREAGCEAAIKHWRRSTTATSLSLRPKRGGSITIERVPEDECPQTPPPSNEGLAEENKRLKAQMEMQSQNITFLENCLLEMGDMFIREFWAQVALNLYFYWKEVKK